MGLYQLWKCVEKWGPHKQYFSAPGHPPSNFESAPTGCLPGAVCYTPQGTPYALSIGQSSSFTGLNLTHTYNSRLQPNEFKASSSGGNAMDITYGFVDPVTLHNAGHVYAITNNLDGTRSQTFTYDQLNRITGALTTSTYSTSPGHCWGEAYSLDAWGNLNSIAATTNSNYNRMQRRKRFRHPPTASPAGSVPIGRLFLFPFRTPISPIPRR